jgi:hypothetical protein
MHVSKPKHRRQQSKRRRQPAPFTGDMDTPVWGAAAIGTIIGKTQRSAFHLLEAGALKGARKVMGQWTARPSALLRAWSTDDAGGDT